LWTGSDDGLVQVSRDGGASWSDVTPPGLPEEIQINSLEAHPFAAGGLYVAATAYKSDDFHPYLFRTDDYGRSWKKIIKGIAPDHFTRVIRADSERRGLLFAGTERGMYASLDDGKTWKAMQLNLPVVPITDLAIKQGNLAVATQGRGYWILDDLSLLRQIDDHVFDQANHLFQPGPAWRLPGKNAKETGNRGQNPAQGLVLWYWLKEDLPADQALELVISDNAGNSIRTFTRKVEEESTEKLLGDDERQLSARAGLNHFVWNLRYPSVEKFEKLVLWNKNLAGPKAVPGSYTARLKLLGEDQQVEIEILADPRTDTSTAQLQAQFDFVWGINRKLTEMHQAITRLRQARTAISAIETRLSGDPRYTELEASAQALNSELTRIEEVLYQTKLESPQDPLNFPIRLNDKLSGVMSLAAYGNNPPTASAVAVRDELVAAVDSELVALDRVLGSDLDAFNEQVAAYNLPAVAVD
jgi:hypothetical protein